MKVTKRRHPRALVLVAVLTWANVSVAAGMVTEVIPIGYRTVDEIVSILRPLVPPPGSVSGAYGKVVVRTTPSNMREVKEILATLDKTPANLLVSVRHTLNEEVRRDLLQVRAEVNTGNASISAGRDAAARRGASVGAGAGDASVSANVASGTRASDDREVQRVRVLEGREAYIATGQSLPVTDRTVVITGRGVTTTQSSVRYKNVDSGFMVRARLNADDAVTVEIAPRRNTLGAGAIDTREAATIVTGRLGRWMEIAGVSGSATRSSTGIGSSASSSEGSDYSVYLKVDRLDR